MGATAPRASSGNDRNRANRSTPERARFGLTGRSVAIDPRQDAARRDIADIALAGRLFAPHYAVPQICTTGLTGADMLSEGQADAPRVSQLLPGEGFAVLDLSGGWAWGYSIHDHYVGYVAADALAPEEQTTDIVYTRHALVLAARDVRAAVRAVLPIGARIAGTRTGEFVETAHGFVPRQHLRPLGDTPPDAVALAEMLIGTPYLWGGRGVGGIDCSGLTQLVHGLVSTPLPRDSDQQAMAGEPAEGALRRGDLLFWPDHVVLIADEESVVHATAHHMAVVREPLDAVIARAGPPTARRRIA